MANPSAPASRNSFSLSFADSPQIRLCTPRFRSSTTASVPRSCLLTLAMYMSMNIRSNDSPESIRRTAVSPFAASLTVQSGAITLMDRRINFRSMGSSSTIRTERTAGNSHAASHSPSLLLKSWLLTSFSNGGVFRSMTVDVDAEQEDVGIH